MRLYTFCNYYLSSIQQGIQSAHVLAEMFVNVDDSRKAELTVLYDWARNHKTMVVLNGGNSLELEQLYGKLRWLGGVLCLPVGTFSEDKQSLNNALTCVGIVVPEKIYVYNEFEREQAKQRAKGGPLADVFVLNPYHLNAEEKELAGIISAYPLAK